MRCINADTELSFAQHRSVLALTLAKCVTGVLSEPHRLPNGKLTDLLPYICKNLNMRVLIREDV